MFVLQWDYSAMINVNVNYSDGFTVDIQSEVDSRCRLRNELRRS